MAETAFRSHRPRRRAGRLCRRDPRGAARHEDRGRRARASRRHLPQLGLHPDQGAAAHLGDLSSAARMPTTSASRPRTSASISQEDRRALAQGREAALERRRLPDEEEQDHRDRRRRRSSPARASSRSSQGRQDRREYTRQEHHPRDRRAGALAARAWSPTASWSGPIARRWCRRRCPKSLLVVGSGAIGIEFASFYRDMGAEVTVVEVLDRVLPVEDEEISAFASKAFEKQGMKIHTGATVEELKKGADNVTATLEAKDGKTETSHRRPRRSSPSASSAMSRISASKAPGVKVEQHPYRRRRMAATGEPGIYAIGDLVGPPWLAHKAMHEGVIVRRAASPASRACIRSTRSNIPGCTYCRPQVASVGLTEAAAKAHGPRDQGRQLPLHRQRQGDRAGRARGPGQDGVRRQDRRAARRAHDRRRSDRADPGLRHRQDLESHRGRTDAHGLPASRPCRK